ncbi:MAG: hypothetical protein CMO04_10890 [Thalassospira sp.]|nr:hypothetical protein [Thalassospira sp.]HAY47825.1 hypothetical protein [Thalassospira sp.]
MRTRFREFALESLPEYKIYLPEYSFKNLFDVRDDGYRFLQLDKFEEVVAELSCCVVLFPEAPGSLVELGLFSANEKIVKRLLVVVDSGYDDGKDSFISLGPVSKVNTGSEFRQVFVDAYDGFNFNKIKNRIEDRHRVSKKHKKIDLIGRKWPEISQFEKLSIVHWIVDVIRLADVETIVFISKSLFGNTVRKNEVVDLVSILIGSDEFSFFGEEKWIVIGDRSAPIITAKSGEEQSLIDVKVDIANFYRDQPVFDKLVREAYS